MVLAPVDGSGENGGCSLLNIYGGPQASLKRVCVVGVGHIEAPSLGRTVARSAGYYCSEAWSLPAGEAVWRLGPGGSTVGSPCQDAGTGPCTRLPVSPKGTFFLSGVCASFQAICSFCDGLAKIKKTDNTQDWFPCRAGILTQASGRTFWRKTNNHSGKLFCIAR